MKELELKDEKSIMQFLQEPTIKIAEGLTGILSADKGNLKLSTGRIVQAALKGKMLTQLGKEINNYIEKGKIKEDYFATNKNQATLLELLKFIDTDIPDEERFRAMKSIFLYSVRKDATEQDEILAYELMQICKDLSSGEVMTLIAVYQISKGETKLAKEKIESGSAQNWLNNTSEQMGHKLSSLTELYEEKLMNKKLISKRSYSDKSGIINFNYRLTNLGLSLCKLITIFE